MAWGTGVTDNELRRIAAVREYLSEQFPGYLIRDSYDPTRLAQVFHIELDVPPTTYIAVISTEFLQDHPPEISRTILASWEVPDRLRAAKGAEMLIMSWGIQTPGGPMRKVGEKELAGGADRPPSLCRRRGGLLMAEVSGDYAGLLRLAGAKSTGVGGHGSPIPLLQ